ncbi:uncharacterized [Tachysurus ichikawai]
MQSRKKHNENIDEELHEAPQRLDQLELKGNSSTLTEPQNAVIPLRRTGDLSQISSKCTSKARAPKNHSLETTQGSTREHSRLKREQTCLELSRKGRERWE